MKKIGKIVLLLILILFATSYYLFKPSGDLSNYNSYFPVTEREAEKGEINVTFFGNTTLLFDDGVTQLLFDPYFSRPTKWQAISSTIGIDSLLIDSITQNYLTHLKGIYVSHSHFDHILDLPLISDITNASTYGSLSTQNYSIANRTKENLLSDYDLEKGHKIGQFHVLPIRSIHSEPTIVNNDLNQVFTSNKRLPYKYSEFKEGGSYDFLITHGKKKFLIKSSFNSLKDQYSNFKIDVAFLGITGLGKANAKKTNAYFQEFIQEINPKLIVPIHWDDFLIPLKYPLTPIFKIADNVPKALDKLIDYQEKYNYQLLLMDAYQTRVF